MRIALISDIHSNLPALEAVLEDIDSKSPEQLYCLGDLVGYAPWPNEVVEEIRKRRIPTLAGNYDQGVGISSDDCGCAYKTEAEKELGKRSIGFTNRIITDKARRFLKDLPAHIRLDFRLTEKEVTSFLMVHGSPRKINEYLFEDRDEKSMSRIMTDHDAAVMAFGHTHKPYHRVIHNGGFVQHAINTGSVGKPKDGDPRACYVMLDLAEVIDSQSWERLKVEFVRVKYDVEKTAKAIENSELPNEFADMLRKAY
jgi:predicted phosphodiesterase